MDAYAPIEVAERVRTVGVAKARRPVFETLVLAALAGAFISLGALLFTVVTTGSSLGFGPTRWLGGAAFSLGLVLVLVGGAELFTGNNLIAMAWASRLITLRDVVTNWGLVYLGNTLGALATVALVYLAGTHHLNQDAVSGTLVAIAERKVQGEPLALFAQGILCNGLVCLAVWLSMAARSVSDKILAIVFPVAGFVAMGFEHCIANLFFLPYAWLLTPMTASGILYNLSLVTLGNKVGGTLLVAGVYSLAYRSPTHKGASP